jgi:hypothetical protein
MKASALAPRGRRPASTLKLPAAGKTAEQKAAEQKEAAQNAEQVKGARVAGAPEVLQAALQLARSLETQERVLERELLPEQCAAARTNARPKQRHRNKLRLRQRPSSKGIDYLFNYLNRIGCSEPHFSDCAIFPLTAARSREISLSLSWLNRADANFSNSGDSWESKWSTEMCDPLDQY